MTKTREASDLINNVYSDFTNNNVGIGTTNATSKLTVGGDVSISGVITATTFVGNGSQLSGLTKVLTIGVRTGIVTFSFTSSSFNVSGRSGNVPINV
jgi:hypothetical protein